MRLLLPLLLLLSAPAWADWPDTDYDDQALTDAGPSTSTDGLPLISTNGAPVRGFMVAVCASSGQMLSGAGTLQAWVYIPGADLWMRNKSLDLTVDLSGKRCQAFPDMRPGILRNRRVYYAATGVTVSSGTVRLWLLRDTTV